MTSYQLLLSWQATSHQSECPVDPESIHNRRDRERIVDHTRPGSRDQALLDFIWATQNLANVIARIWRARVVEVEGTYR